MNTFTNLDTFLNSKLNSLLGIYINGFANQVIILMQMGITTLILYYGYSIMTPRGSNASINEMLFNMVRIAIVFAFVKNSAGLLDLAIGFIHELKTGFIGAPNLFTLLDEQFIVTQKLTVKIMKVDDSITGFIGVLASLMIWSGSILVLASAAIVFIAAEVGLALLTVTSPIFIGCLTYGFTRELFNGWLRSIFSCIITLIFSTLVVRIGIDINNQMIKQLASDPEKNSLLTIGATSLVVGIIVSSLVFVATKMASNIAGVAASSAIQGGMMVATRAGNSIARNAINQGGRGSQAAGRGIGNIPGDVKEKVAENSQERKQGDTLRAESRKASFARVQQTNSQS